MRHAPRPSLTVALALLPLVACSQGGGGAVEDGGAPGDADPTTDADTGGSFSTAPHPAEPQIPYGQGPLLVPLHLVTVLASNDALQSDLAAYAKGLPSSSWWAAVKAAYSLGDFDVTTVVGPAMTAPTMKDADVLTYLHALIAAHPAIAPTGTSLYFVFLPDGVDHINNDGSGAGCDTEMGFHTWFSQTGNDAWGLAQRCPGASGLSDLESTFSHEVAEAATDPDVQSGYLITASNPDQPWLDTVWTYSGGGEAGDLCENSLLVDGNDTYQRIWSNQAAAAGGDPCIPSLGIPYAAVSAPMEWYPVMPGATVTVTVTGFSTAPTDDWPIDPVPYVQSPTAPNFTVKLDSATHGRFFGMSYPTVNNGRTATLTVTAPPAAPSGVWSHLLLSSYPTAGTDYSHDWPVGFYVP